MLSWRIERQRENYKKTIAVYSESLCEKSISSLLVFDYVTIAADRTPNTGKYCHNSSLNYSSCSFNMLLPVKQFSREYINKDLLIFVINAESKQVFVFKILSPTSTRTFNKHTN